jgi:hypothetical protein
MLLSSRLLPAATCDLVLHMVEWTATSIRLARNPMSRATIAYLSILSALVSRCQIFRTANHDALPLRPIAVCRIQPSYSACKIGRRNLLPILLQHLAALPHFGIPLAIPECNISSPILPFFCRAPLLQLFLLHIRHTICKA